MNVELKKSRLSADSLPVPQLVVLPWGALEPHNYHLPYGTDTYEAEYIAVSAARLAAEKGALVSVLPAVPFGVNGAQLGFPMVINLNPSTQYAILHDICSSLRHHGVNKLILLNGHGGNEFKPAIRELQLAVPEVFIAVIDWWKLPPVNAIIPDPGDHAGSLETSVMLAIYPELVAPLESAGTGTERKPIIKAMSEGWLWSPRIWHKVTADSGIGNPASASAEAGEKVLAEACELIAQAIYDLSKCRLDELYQSV